MELGHKHVLMDGQLVGGVMEIAVSTLDSINLGSS
jgi:hypothetical protein